MSSIDPTSLVGRLDSGLRPVSNSPTKRKAAAIGDGRPKADTRKVQATAATTAAHQPRFRALQQWAVPRNVCLAAWQGQRCDRLDRGLTCKFDHSRSHPALTLTPHPPPPLP